MAPEAARLEESAMPDVSASVPRRFGDYDLLSVIAHGGMGIVYRARQLSLPRIVALKMLLFGKSAEANDVARFQREAEAVANLHHPNIVAIHEVGRHDDQQYFSMEYVAGQTLAELARGGLPAPRAARYLETIAEAVEYAHRRGVLHRDLKPSNILIDERDQPRITDFGLAKRLSDTSELTHTGQMLGSPGYMPPEQAGGRSDRVGPSSDVYSLGAILYHLVTGRPPFLAERIEDTLLQVLQKDPLPPRLLNPALPLDLETICMKCLEKEPTKRYSTARSLADDLSRFLEGKHILARRVGPTGKLVRWCSRKPVVAGLIFALLLVFAAGLSGVLWQWRRARASEALTRYNLYDADMNLASQALDEHNIGLALKLLEAHAPQPGEVDLRGWEWRYFRRQCEGDEIATLGRHELSAQHIAFSADGKVIGSAAEDSFKLWEPSSGRQLASGVHARERRPASRSRIAFAPTREILATSGIDGVVRLWDRSTLRKVEDLQHDGTVFDVVFSPDGALLATVTVDLAVDSVGERGRVQLWDLETRETKAQLDIDGARSLSYSPDGATIAIGSEEGEIVLWDLSPTRRNRVIRAHRRKVTALAFLPDGKLLASAGSESFQASTIRIWDVAELRETACLTGHANWIAALAVSADGRTLASASADRTIKLWDIAARHEVATLRGHLDEVWGVAFSPDGRRLASSSKDGEVKVWETTPRDKPVDSLPLPEGTRRYALSPTGDALLTETSDGTLHVWNVIDPRASVDFTIPGTRGACAAVSPGGQVFAFGGHDGGIDVWRKGDAGAVHVTTLQGPSGCVFAAFSRSGKVLASAGSDGSVWLWDVFTSRNVSRLETPGARVGLLTFSQDDSLLAAAKADWTVEVWDLVSSTRRAFLTGHKGVVTGIAVSSGGRAMATVSLDATAILWDLERGRKSGTLEGQLYALYSSALSMDGRRLAVGGADGTIKLWDLELQRTVGTLKGHQGPVQALAFLPDGDTLASVSDDRLAVWRAAPSDGRH